MQGLKFKTQSLSLNVQSLKCESFKYGDYPCAGCRPLSSGIDIFDAAGTSTHRQR